MAKITYLIGAGASFQALPIVSEMASQIQECIHWLNQQFKRQNVILGLNIQSTEKYNDVINDLQWLKEVCNTKRNFSVDTYARKLHLSGRTKEYSRLKNILSFYFTIEQKRNLPDVRYDNFWASILKHKLDFPDNIKILSWNYDFQFELTYQGFYEIESLLESRNTIRIRTLQTPEFDLDDPEIFSIFKLNGSATFTSNKTRGINYLIDEFNSTELDDFIQESVDTYQSMKSAFCENHLSFAWEQKLSGPFYTHLKKSIEATEVLVVIGYSFPFFNREIDKFILKDSMKSLKKVYFQAPDAEDLRERFLAINDDILSENLLLRKDLKQFTLPNEL